jgi:AcrR family transcriptional regulator
MEDKRRKKGEASAQRIINATIDLIAAEGLGKTTMQRIAAQVGATTALVVFHFRNMENLHTAVLEHLGALYEAMWQERVHAPGLSAAQRLSGALDCAQSFMQRHPKGVSVLIAFSGDLKSAQLYRKITLPSDRVYLATGRQLVEEIAREGGYKDIDLDVVSESVNYLIFGSWLWDHVEPKASHAPMLRKCGQLLLEHIFPKHFPVERHAAARR